MSAPEWGLLRFLLGGGVGRCTAAFWHVEALLLLQKARFSAIFLNFIWILTENVVLLQNKLMTERPFEAHINDFMRKLF